MRKAKRGEAISEPPFGPARSETLACAQAPRTGTGRSLVRPGRSRRRTASGRRGAVADDERAREVRPRHSSREVDERSGAIRFGADGAKGGDRGKGGPAKRVPDTGPGRRVTSAGAPTASRKAQQEGEIHRAHAPRHHRTAGNSVPRHSQVRRGGCRRSDVAGLRSRPRAQAREPARESP